jgi:mono/diheme cytochrome c family protein
MKWLKRLGLVLGVLGILVIGAAAFLELRSAKARPIDVGKKFESTPARIEKGRYLTNQTGCFLCHSEHDWQTHGAPEVPGMEGAGWDVPYAENKMPGKVFASNITPDPDTGIGLVPDDAVARAIREGVGRDGRALFMMPWPDYRHLSDEEVASIVVYLRTLKPVKKQRQKTEIIVPVRWFLKFTPQPLTTAVPDPDQSTPLARGKHIAEIGNCQECHTPVNERHEPLPGLAWAGGQEFRGPFGLVRSSNITPHASGLAHYNEELFLRTIRTGNIGGRRLNPLMPWHYHRHMTDDDLKALWAYLKTVPAVAHDVPREEVKLKDNPAIAEHPAPRTTDSQTPPPPAP